MIFSREGNVHVDFYGEFNRTNGSVEIKEGLNTKKFPMLECAISLKKRTYEYATDGL